MKVLCLAEKPSQAKEIATKLSDNTHTSRPGTSFIWNYEFEFQYQNQLCQFIMTSLVGHVQEFSFPLEYKNWNACHPKLLFNLPVTKIIPEDKLQVVENLKRLARQCQVLIIWTDCDREGENIGMEGAKICLEANPRIQIKRAKFSVMLSRELKYACQHPGEIDLRLVDAVDTRAEIDLRTGAALTRFQTLLLQKTFPSLQDNLISYGSCQFPTLGFIVDRYFKIKNFVPEEYYKIEMKHNKDGLDVEFSWKRGQLFDQFICLILYERSLNFSKAKVVNIHSKPTSKWKPLPLTTVELQKLGSKYLKMSSDKIMEIANKLYLNGFISYPRTETDIFDKKTDLKALIEKQTLDPRFKEFSDNLLNGGFTWPRNGKNNDMSHPPIHPTAAAPALEGDERKVYEFIVRRFLGTCSQDAKGQQTVIEVKLGEEYFSAKGLVIHEFNYLNIYTYEKWNAKTLPMYQLNEEFIPTVLNMVDGLTTPPKPLTEADLISIMSKNGIGTDATIHEHIKKVLDRKYVYKEGTLQYFYPYDLGIALVEGYDKVGLEKSLSKPFLRRELENSLKAICEGTQTKREVLDKAIKMYFDVFNITIQNTHSLIETVGIYFQKSLELDTNINTTTSSVFTSEPIMNCDLCGQMMTLKTASNGSRLLGCSGYPNCTQSMWFNKEKFQHIEAMDSHCSKCSNSDHVVRLLRFFIKNNLGISELDEIYEACVKCDDTLYYMYNLKFTSNSTINNSNRITNNHQNSSTLTNRNSNSLINNSAQSNRNPIFNSVENPAFNTQNENSTRTNNNPTLSYNGAVNMDLYRQSIMPNNSNSRTSPPRCGCNLLTTLEVVKSGTNTGRRYYKCSTVSQRCQFFQWADESNSSNSMNSSLIPSNLNNINVTCFKCGQIGHYANECSTNELENTLPTINNNRTSILNQSRFHNSNAQCFRCNQIGHYATSCPQSVDPPNTRNRGRGKAIRSNRSKRGSKSKKRGKIKS